MVMALPAQHLTLVTPLRSDDLLDPGSVFPRAELTRRILSYFWRDCCCPTCFSRAPAPVAELNLENPARRVRAWWLLEDVIFEEHEGPYSERLRPYFHTADLREQLWPRYEFFLRPAPLVLEMIVHREPLARHR